MTDERAARLGRLIGGFILWAILTGCAVFEPLNVDRGDWIIIGCLIGLQGEVRLAADAAQRAARRTALRTQEAGDGA